MIAEAPSHPSTPELAASYTLLELEEKLQGFDGLLLFKALGVS